MDKLNICAGLVIGAAFFFGGMAGLTLLAMTVLVGLALEHG